MKLIDEKLPIEVHPHGVEEAESAEQGDDHRGPEPVPRHHGDRIEPVAQVCH